MKKIKLLILALVTMISTGAWGAVQYDIVQQSGDGAGGEMTAQNIKDAVSSNGSVDIALITVSNTCKNYYLSITAQKSQSLNSSNVWTVTLSGTADRYLLQNKQGAYIKTTSTSISNQAVETTTDVSQAALLQIIDRNNGGADTDPYNGSGYHNTSLVLNGTSNGYINVNGTGTAPIWKTGTGGFSCYSVKKVTSTVVPDPAPEGLELGKGYFLKHTESGKYVSMTHVGKDSGNNPLLQEKSECVPLYISYADDGKYFLNTEPDNSGNYLGANSWNCRSWSTSCPWTIAKTGEGTYSLYQTTGSAGYMKADMNGSTWIGGGTYCNNGSAVNFEFEESSYVDYSFDPNTLFAGKYITAISAEQTGDLTPSTEQWYILKQSRGTSGKQETPAYDAGVNANILRAAVGTDVAVDDAALSKKEYLVRIVSSNEFNDAVYIQFGTSNFFASGDTGNNPLKSKTTPGNYLVYPATQNTSGWSGHYAINETTDGTTYGRKVDNNMPGGTVAYWNSGETTSGTNNIWALYPVTLDELSQITYTVHIYGDPTGNASVVVPGDVNMYGNNKQVTCAPIADASTLVVTSITNYRTEVAVEGTNINVTYVVNNAAAFENGKAFVFNTERGFMFSKTGDATLYANYAGVSFTGTDANKQFAVIKSTHDNYYLYNIAEQKFAYHDGSTVKLQTNPCTAGHMTFGTSSNATYNMLVSVDSKKINVSSSAANKIYIGWETQDPGNQWQIMYAGAYDLSTAVAAVETFESGADLTNLTTALTRAGLYTVGSGLNQYSEVTSGRLAAAIATGQAMTVNNTQEEVNAATDELNAAISELTFNLPVSGTFFRIKGATGGGYIADGHVSSDNQRFTMSEAQNNSTLFFYRDGKIMNVGTGKYNGASSSSWAWQNDVADASTMTFTESDVVGYYIVTSANVYLYDGGSYLDRGQSLGDNQRYHKWVLEAVDAADVTVTVKIGSTKRGTFANALPLNFAETGVTAYVCTGLTQGSEVNLCMEAVTTVDAATGLYVAGAEGEYVIPVYTGTSFSSYSGDSFLVPVLPRDITSGTTLHIDQTDGSNTNYILQNQPSKGGLKFYKVNTSGNSVAANRAYLQLPSDSNAKEVLGVDIEDDPTGINDIVNGQQSTVNGMFDLSGRKVNAQAKGIIIVNGRKVLVK